MVELEAMQKWQTLEALRVSEVPLLLARFSAQLAHEIGTPLNIITGHASMIPGLDAAGQQNAAKKIVEQANRIAAIVREALSAVSPPAGKRESIVLAPLLDEVASVVGSQHDTAAALAEQRVRGDRGQLLFALIALANGGMHVAVELSTLPVPPDVAKPARGFACLTMTSAATSPMASAATAWVAQLNVAAAQRVLREHGGFLASANGEHRACLPIEEN